jgi:hypothetical protein
MMMAPGLVPAFYTDIVITDRWRIAKGGFAYLSGGEVHVHTYIDVDASGQKSRLSTVDVRLLRSSLLELQTRA